MQKSIALITCTLFMFVIAKAQQSNITGTIKDTTSGNSVKNAVVALLNFKDSTIVNFTRAKENGSYSLDKISEGKYIFMVMHPSFADYVEDVDVKGTDIKMPPVSVTPKSKLLEAVIIRSGGTMRIKGDTTIYTADSFKVSANANVEELLKKMPGIQVDKNGQIKAMGETVEKVLVEGEEFFGDDPGMAVKNLRADAIKEVQVFKKKSDQAEFTGIDDGQSKQTINLKLKEDKKKGYFGKIDAAGGPLKNEDPRYNSNLMFSSFKGKRKLSAFLLNGNTGQDGLSWQDMEKFGGRGEMNMEVTDDGGIMMWSSGGSADGEPYINTENGFITNMNAGIQYSNKFKNNLHSLNLSPKYNSQLYNNNNTNFTRSDIAGSVLSTNRNTVSDVNRSNIKLSGTYDMKLDSAGNSTLKITVGTNIYNTKSNEAQNSITTGNSPSDIKNRANSITDKEIDKQAYNISALYKHKFKKNRRTISFNASAYQLNTNADSYLDRSSETFTQGTSDGVLLTDQLAQADKLTKTFAGKIIYTEPLSKKFALEIGHELSFNSGKNKQQTFGLDAISGKYDIEVDSLSNNFNQNIVVNQPSVKISYGGKKLKYSFGAGVGFTNFDLKDITEDNHYKRTYTNFFPSANLTYNYKSNSSVRLSYSGRTSQPSLNQLQPLRNNNDQFNIYLGNPNLKQSFAHSFNASINSYNFIKDTWKYISMWSSITQNSFTNSRVIDTAKGTSIYQPVNTDGNFSMGLWGGTGFKIKKIGVQIGINPNMNFNRYADIINGQKSFSKTTDAGLSIDITKSKDKKYDLSFSNSYNYNLNSNAQRSGTRKFSTNNVRLNGKVYYKKVWSLSTDFSYYYWQNPDGGENINNNIWNARVERTFKNNEFTVYLQARDLLNENIGINRNFYGNSYSEEINDRIKRYFMVGFRWDFKNKAPKAKETPAVGALEIK